MTYAILIEYKHNLEIKYKHNLEIIIVYIIIFT